ncbi:MAG TPA: YbaB/EbfC family DNA-binding protein [Mycobacterium sp.]|nr:YbaB/EbfC family DNA-binding protein [Mycobacterium sp.]
MVGDFPPHEPDDDDDGLAALAVSYPEPHPDEAALDALGSYVAGEPDDDDDAHWDPADSDGEDVELALPLFAITNPPGTVTVTSYMDGRVHQIDLAPKVTKMTETDLADEILVIAGLAREEARSAQYSFMLEGLREQGHEDFATREFLTRDLHLPTPEQAETARAQVFSTRYGGDHG